MPELPEVQTTVNGLKSRVIGKIITDVWTDYNSSFHAGKTNIKNPLFFKEFKKAILHTKIISAERRAKIVIIHLSNNISILTHMKMTGHYMVGHWTIQKTFGKNIPIAKPGTPASDDPFNAYIHLLFTFKDGNMLGFSDMRKFAHITYTKTSELNNHPLIRELGPEPLDSTFTTETLKQALLKKPQGKIKQVLMEQNCIAGIGNIYSDEVLWLSGIHPSSIIKKIPTALFPKIHRAIMQTLSQGINFGGDSMSDYRNIDGVRGEFQHQHNAYRKTNKPCGKRGCKGTILRMKIGARSAHFCDTHQIMFH